MTDLFREPVNTLTHLAGALLFLAGGFLLVRTAGATGEFRPVFSSLVFTAGLVGLYTSSALYHAVRASQTAIRRLRNLDHSMIYVLIASTYTPVCLTGLGGRLGTGVLLAIWGAALAGVVLRLASVSVHRWIYTGFYLALGWSSLLLIRPLVQRFPPFPLFLLVLGGLFYTVGAIIYGKRPPSLQFGPFRYHEVFHLFILAGSVTHYLFIYFFVIRPF